MREKAIKGRLVEQARIGPGHDVLDVGCGTGTLALMVKKREPRARVVGVDGDAGVLAIARRKVAAAGVEVTLCEGLADNESLFAAESFDRIVTSLMLHSLKTDERLRAFVAMRRWLRPGGRLDVLDFGPRDQSQGGLLARLFGSLHGGEILTDNLAGRLPEQMREAG